MFTYAAAAAVTMWCTLYRFRRGRRSSGLIDEQLVQQPFDGREDVHQTDAQAQHGDGHGDQHGITVAVGRLPPVEQRFGVVVVPRGKVVGPTQLIVFVARRRRRRRRDGVRAAAVVVALVHAYLDRVQELDAAAAGRGRAVPPPHQRAAVPFVQHPFGRHVIVRVAVVGRRTVGRVRRRRPVAAADGFEQHVVQDAHRERCFTRRE